MTAERELPDRIKYQCESGHWSMGYAKRPTHCTARACTVEGPYGPECGEEIFDVAVDSDYYFGMLDEIDRLETENQALKAEVRNWKPDAL